MSTTSNLKLSSREISPGHVEATELSNGKEAFIKIKNEIEANKDILNEANTRFHIIDRVLIECLGYPRSAIKCEVHSGGDYADYCIDQPLRAIWEAKGGKIPFDLPVKASQLQIQNLASVAAASKDAEAAIRQVNGYCDRRACEVALTTNGHQFIAFKRGDFSDGINGKAYVIYSLNDFEANFAIIWRLLSYQGLKKGTLIEYLKRSDSSLPPKKLSDSIPGYPKFKERTELQVSLKTIADILLLDIEKQKELEKSFYSDCYVESGGLAQNSTVSKTILAARYASLFGEEERGVHLSSVKEKKGKDLFTPSLLAEAISSKPIILLGDVGVGKSSFIKHLRYVSAHDEFKHAIYIYIDLAFNDALSSSLNELVLRGVEETLNEEHGIDIQENEFVRRVYKKPLQRFHKGPSGLLKELDPKAFLIAEIEFLNKKISDRSEHLIQSIKYLSSEKRKQLIITIDNADQRDPKTQQEAFIIAQSIATNWKAAVFISMRPATYFSSKRAGILSAYQSRVFTISPPRIDAVLEKRLKFAIDIAEGRVGLDLLKNIGLNLGNIVSILNVIIPSINASNDIQIFLQNITGGNIRSVVEFLAELIGSPNVDTEGLIRGLADNQRYSIPLHDFWKVSLKGEFEYFDPRKVQAVNVFDVYSNEVSEHFLAPLILSYLAGEGAHRASEGFVSTVSLLSEMQNNGYGVSSCEKCLRRLVNDKIIETPSRVSFEEDELGPLGILPDKLRVNSAGAYYLKNWIGTFVYLDAVAVDTQIFDPKISDSLRENIQSLSLQNRYDRASVFRDYLTEAWTALGLSLTYFDWEEICRGQDWTFKRVSSAIVRLRQ